MTATERLFRGDKDEYLSYKSRVLDFVQARNQRILNSTINGT